MSNLYQLAVLDIKNTIAARQAELDAAAAKARADFSAALAIGLIDPEESEDLPVASLAAATITVGRDDGYPAVTIPETTRKVLKAANAAGVIGQTLGGVKFNSNYSGYDTLSPGLQAKFVADYTAWDAAKTYRNANIQADSL